MWCGVVTLFPEMISSITNYGIMRRALAKNLFTLQTFNPRDFAVDEHKTVDDRPYGGGPGMVMKVEPLYKAISAAKQTAATKSKIRVIALSPQGHKVSQENIRQLTLCSHVIFVAGRYEGMDERLYSLAVDEQWSIGDYILSGGELAAMVLIDATVRLLPGVLGNELSAREESFGERGLLDYPQYTRPEEIYGMRVPKILLTGNHQEIAKWRLQEQLRRTKLRAEVLQNTKQEGQ